MSYWPVGLIGVVLLLMVVAAMLVGWRRQRETQQAVFPPLPVLPPGLSERGETRQWRASYVATTRGDDPFARVVANGVGFRGDALLSVFGDGVLVDRDGEAAIFIPAGAVRGAQLASTAIDRGVEDDGLVAVAWDWGREPVVTTLRPREAGARWAIIDAVIGIAGPGTGTIDTTR